MAKLKLLNVALTISSFVGLGLSVYSFYIEQQPEDYKAHCDISEMISCSKTFKSEYGTGFGIVGTVFGKESPLNKPNSLLGIIFYSTLIILGQSNNKLFTIFHFTSSIISLLMSLYLAYVMVMKLGTICVVCLSTYLVNLFNFLLCRAKIKQLKKMEIDKKTS